MVEIPDSIPNPWISNSNSGAPQPRGEPAPTNAAQPAGSPNLSDGVAYRSLPSGESDPSVTLDCTPSESISHIHEIFVGHAKENHHRFVLDEEAFMIDLEALPMFLSRTG